VGDGCQQEKGDRDAGRGDRGQGQDCAGQREAQTGTTSGASGTGEGVGAAGQPDLEEDHGRGVDDQQHRDDPVRGIGPGRDPQRYGDAQHRVVDVEDAVESHEPDERPIAQDLPRSALAGLDCSHSRQPEHQRTGDQQQAGGRQETDLVGGRPPDGQHDAAEPGADREPDVGGHPDLSPDGQPQLGCHDGVDHRALRTAVAEVGHRQDQNDEGVSRHVTDDHESGGRQRLEPEHRGEHLAGTEPVGQVPEPDARGDRDRRRRGQRESDGPQAQPGDLGHIQRRDGRGDARPDPAHHGDQQQRRMAHRSDGRPVLSHSPGPCWF